jgi:hypothetical protein
MGEAEEVERQPHSFLHQAQEGLGLQLIQPDPTFGIAELATQSPGGRFLFFVASFCAPGRTAA